MRLARHILTGIILLTLCSCAGYRLGPSNGLRAGEKTIRIVPATNRTLEPRLGDAATAALRKEIQRDGTYRLVTSGAADIVVTCELFQYDRGEVSFVSGDIVTARDYRISLSAHVSAKETASDKTILARDFTGNTLMRVGKNLPSVERQTLPMLAADLARHITAALTDGSW